MQPDQTLLLDASLGSALVSLLLLLALLALKDARATPTGRTLALLSLSLCSLTLLSHPASGAFGDAITLLLLLAAAPNVGLVWAMCLLLLSDGAQRDAGWMVVGVLALAIAPLIFGLGQWGLGTDLADAIAPWGIVPVALAGAHLCWVALSQYRGDLIEARRKVRFVLVGLLAAATALSILSEDVPDIHMQHILRNGAIGVPLSLLLLFWLVRLHPSLLAFAPDMRPAGPPPSIDPRDRHLADRVEAAMAVEKLFLEANLTVEQLALLLEVPTHRLRAVINRAMGHRNFAAFVNGYRIAHAKQALADPARGRDTILAIAYQSGFSSLQTFNRVFRDGVGATPTDYRRVSLATLPESENSAP